MDSISDGNPKIKKAEEAYMELMHDTEKFVLSQKKMGENDPNLVRVKDVVTKEMFEELKEEMLRQRETSEDHWVGIEEVATLYETTFAQRSIVNGILFDIEVGEKRLCSWPDRFTNTIQCFDMQGQRTTKYRPSVINFSCEPGLGL